MTHKRGAMLAQTVPPVQQLCLGASVLARLVRGLGLDHIQATEGERLGKN
jgi:hypothetical protein